MTLVFELRCDGCGATQPLDIGDDLGYLSIRQDEAWDDDADTSEAEVVVVIDGGASARGWTLAAEDETLRTLCPQCSP